MTYQLQLYLSEQKSVIFMYVFHYKAAVTESFCAPLGHKLLAINPCISEYPYICSVSNTSKPKV